MDRRIASLDYVRGIAAYAVSVAHFITMNDATHPLAESIAMASVEVFFVLSGFVLAPQVLMLMGKPTRYVQVFLVRRWLRTIPPYLIALTLMSVVTGQFLSIDYFRYLFYLQNFAWQANHVDYYPVAWSLSVEEWFYVGFAPILFLIAKAFRRNDIRFATVFGIAFILAVTALRLVFGPMGDWDADVRRISIFRVDSIAWGFLLSIVMASYGSRISARTSLFLSAILFVPLCTAAIYCSYLTRMGSSTAQLLFPYAATGLGLSSIWFFASAFPLNATRWSREIGFLLGRLSYSVYLFHLVLVVILRSTLQGMAFPVQLFVYLVSVTAVAWIVSVYVEQPILATRPKYGPIEKKQARSDALRLGRFARTWWPVVPAAVAILIALLTYRAGALVTFYLCWVSFGALLAFAFFRCTRSLALRQLGLTLAFGTAAVPVMDVVQRAQGGGNAPVNSGGMITPVYSYAAASSNPKAFQEWWQYYVAEWTRPDGGKANTEMADPRKILPFVMKPNSSGRFFGSTLRVNNVGFRGPDIPIDKGNRYRVFALGESPTLGPTLKESERPWPEILQRLVDTRLQCSRPVEIVNAGTEAYSLKDNIERVKRDIIPLKPDLVISYHGNNGLWPLIGDWVNNLGVREPLRVNGPSPTMSRLAFAAKQALHEIRTLKTVTYSDDYIDRSEYAERYRQLIDLSRQHGFKLVLGTASMAVDERSPTEVKTFYNGVFPSINDIIARNAAHNRLVMRIARQHRLRVVDTRPALDGRWDDDYYLDIVHFTDRGNRTIAEVMFRNLEPVFMGREPACRPK